MSIEDGKVKRNEEELKGNVNRQDKQGEMTLRIDMGGIARNGYV